MRYRIFITCLMLYLSSGAGVMFGQKIDLSTLLSDALNDPSLLILDRSHQEISSIKYSLPLLEKVELNINERLYLARQSFQLRTSFNGLGLRKAERNKFSALLNYNASKNESARHTILLQRYLDLCDWVHLSENYTLAKKYLSYYLELENISEIMLSNGVQIDLADYVKVKEDIMQEKTKIKYLDGQVASLLKKMKCDTSYKLNDQEIIMPEPAWTKLQEINPDFDLHTLLTEIYEENNYLKATLEREKAASKKIIDYTQLRYILRDNLDPQYRFSLGIGLVFPWNGSGVLKQLDITVKQNALSAEKEIKQINLKDNFDTAKNDFLNYYDQYAGLVFLKNDPKILKLKNQILQSGRIDPLKSLQLQASSLQTESRLAFLKYKMMTSYIQALHNAGVLYSKPYRNFLHPLFPILIVR